MPVVVPSERGLQAEERQPAWTRAGGRPRAAAVTCSRPRPPVLVGPTLRAPLTVHPRPFPGRPPHDPRFAGAGAGGGGGEAAGLCPRGGPGAGGAGGNCPQPRGSSLSVFLAAPHASPTEAVVSAQATTSPPSPAKTGAQGPSSWGRQHPGRGSGCRPPWFTTQPLLAFSAPRGSPGIP